jgi:hypothetical protein
MYLLFDEKNKNSPIQTELALCCILHKFIPVNIKDNDLFCDLCKTKFLEDSHLNGFKPVLRTFSCPKCLVSFKMKLNGFMPGTKISAVVNKNLDSDLPFHEDNHWTEEDKRKIQEEEGLSDEDMANGAWIDF